MSVVRIGLSPRAKALSRVAAQEHWAGMHASLFAQVPRLQSYVQNHAVLSPQGETLLADPQFDVFSEVEFESEADMVEAMASAWYNDVVIPDEHKLLDATRRCFLTTRRFGAAAAPAGVQCKLVEFVSGAPQGGAPSGPENWLSDIRLTALIEGAESEMVTYLVDAVGGTVLRSVDVVLARWCEAIPQAREIHQRLHAALQAERGLAVHAAVIVRENSIIPRRPAAGAH